MPREVAVINNSVDILDAWFDGSEGTFDIQKDAASPLRPQADYDICVGDGEVSFVVFDDRVREGENSGLIVMANRLHRVEDKFNPIEKEKILVGDGILSEIFVKKRSFISDICNLTKSWFWFFHGKNSLAMDSAYDKGFVSPENKMLVDLYSSINLGGDYFRLDDEVGEKISIASDESIFKKQKDRKMYESISQLVQADGSVKRVFSLTGKALKDFVENLDGKVKGYKDGVENKKIGLFEKNLDNVDSTKIIIMSSQELSICFKNLVQDVGGLVLPEGISSQFARDIFASGITIQGKKYFDADSKASIKTFKNLNEYLKSLIWHITDVAGLNMNACKLIAEVATQRVAEMADQNIEHLPIGRARFKNHSLENIHRSYELNLGEDGVVRLLIINSWDSVSGKIFRVNGLPGDIRLNGENEIREEYFGDILSARIIFEIGFIPQDEGWSKEKPKNIPEKIPTVELSSAGVRFEIHDFGVLPYGH